MVYIYIIINILYIVFGNKYYNSKINPISIYSILWTLMVGFYELKLVYYYDLTMTTWLVIIIFQLAYNFGCILGKIKYNKQVITQNIYVVNDKKTLKKIIIILSLLSSISALSNFFIAIRKYGANLLMYTNQLYADRLSGDIENGIPYLGTFIYPALIYSGVYFYNYGFNKIILLPIILSVLGQLKSGGRLGFLVAAFFLCFPIILKKDNSKKRKGEIKGENKKISNVKILFIVSVFVILFIVITRNRSIWINYNPYMSPLMEKFVQYNPSIYKNYTYFTSPLGVLNEFLKKPSFNFGGHTFLTIYNFLNKLGANISVSKYQTLYYVPITSNVGTYIRELIEDFTVFPAIIITIFVGWIFSYNFFEFKNRNSYINLIWTSVFGFVVFFSFFMWNFRSSTMWMTIVIGSVSGYVLDRKCKKIKNS